jgi:hypothetical protein
MITNLRRDDLAWEGNIELVDWDAYFGVDLKLELNIGGDSKVDQIAEVHEKGYKYLLEKQLEILSSITNELFRIYPTWQEEYGYDEDEKENLMPNIDSKEDFKSLITPIRVYILDVEKNNSPYVGIEFFCKWDEEHGVGVLLHRNRVVRIGGAETAFMSWIAEEDRDAVIQ